MENAKNFWNSFKSNFYVREPIYESSARAKRTYEGYYLAAIAISPFIVALILGIVNKV